MGKRLLGFFLVLSEFCSNFAPRKRHGASSNQ